MKKLSQEYYIRKCIDIHGDKYDYSLVKYVGEILNSELSHINKNLIK